METLVSWDKRDFNHWQIWQKSSSESSASRVCKLFFGIGKVPSLHSSKKALSIDFCRLCGLRCWSFIRLTQRWNPTPGSATQWAPVNEETKRRDWALTRPCQQGFISRETKGESRKQRRMEGGKEGGREWVNREGGWRRVSKRRLGNIQKGHPQFLSRNDIFPLRNKHLSDLFIGFIRSDSLVKPFPAAAAAGHHS